MSPTTGPDLLPDTYTIPGPPRGGSGSRGSGARASGSPGPAPRPAGFRPDIEGLRAVAVLAVLAFHASVPGLAGGFVGVDVFLVVSGYLITGLLVREAVTTGRVRLGSSSPAGHAGCCPPPRWCSARSRWPAPG